ncbi:UNVERIFIED_CONTAM: hypothetical protein N8J90_16455 [Halobacillus marinus]
MKKLDDNKGKEGYLQAEIDFLKDELLTELEAREKDLKELKELKDKYDALENRYRALRDSYLGRVTRKYWTVRKKLNAKGAK